MTKMILAAALVVSAMTAQAGILTSTGAVKTTIDDVNVLAGATATVNGQSINLTTLGAGMRSKKVLFINVQVYVGQLLTDNAGQVTLTSTNFLSQLNNNNTSAFTMTFVRAVSSDQLVPAFQDGFNANNIDMTAAPIQALLNAVTAAGDVDTNDVLTFLISHNADGSQTLSFQDQKGNVTAIAGGADKNLTSEILSLWLGNAADSGVTNLKNSILQGF